MLSVCCGAPVTERFFSGSSCNQTGYREDACMLYRCTECGTESPEVEIEPLELVELQDMLEAA